MKLIQSCQDSIVAIVTGKGAIISNSPNSADYHIIDADLICIYEYKYIGIKHTPLSKLKNRYNVSDKTLRTYYDNYKFLRKNDTIKEAEVEQYLNKHGIDYPLPPILELEEEEPEDRLISIISNYENLIKEHVTLVKEYKNELKQKTDYETIIKNYHTIAQTYKQIITKQTEALQRTQETKGENTTKLSQLISSDLIKFKNDIIQTLSQPNENNRDIHQIQRLQEENEYLLKLAKSPIEALNNIKELLGIIKQICHTAQSNEDNFSYYEYYYKEQNFINIFFTYIYKNHSNILANLNNLEVSNKVVESKLLEINHNHLSEPSN